MLHVTNIPGEIWFSSAQIQCVCMEGKVQFGHRNRSIGITPSWLWGSEIWERGEGVEAYKDDY